MSQELKKLTRKTKMLLSEFDYELPKELIAQTPVPRGKSRMLMLDKTSGKYCDKHFYDIVDLIDENSILVLNNTKVIPARLFGHKESGALIEIFLLKDLGNKFWEALIKPSKRVKSGHVIKISEELCVEIIELIADGKWRISLKYDGNLYEILDRVGKIPLPPYIERKMTQDEYKELDFERYQTVFAKHEGSVAAPTAGLHFSDKILQQLKNKGVEICYVTLNVGLGTFRPVKCENVLEHKMDSESFVISQETADCINKAKSEGKKLIAVGTTTVRTLETAFKKYGRICECQDSSELFIYPSYEFKIVDNLITNFHLPKSTLLMLVSALAGKDEIFEAYHHAIDEKYRFYSYGDCMYIC